MRLFVALELPEPVGGALGDWARATLGGDEGLRLVDRAALHVTLVFLGWREPAETEQIAAAIAAATAGLEAPSLRPTGLLALPRGRPRVLAVGLSDADDRAATAQAAIADALAAAGLYEPERRRFRPHVTVARVRRGATPAERASVPLPDRTFAAPRIVLYRSHLGPSGARYEALAEVTLGG